MRSFLISFAKWAAFAVAVSLIVTAIVKCSNEPIPAPCTGHGKSLQAQFQPGNGLTQDRVVYVCSDGHVDDTPR